MSYTFVPNLEAIGHVTLVSEPENRPASWRKKPFQSKTAEVRQKIFHMVECLKMSFHLNQSTFGHDEIYFLFSFFFLLFPFFFLIFVRSSSKPQNIEI